MCSSNLCLFRPLNLVDSDFYGVAVELQRFPHQHGNTFVGMTLYLSYSDLLLISYTNRENIIFRVFFIISHQIRLQLKIC